MRIVRNNEETVTPATEKEAAVPETAKPEKAPKAKATPKAKAPKAPKGEASRDIVLAFAGEPAWIPLAEISANPASNTTRPEGIDAKSVEALAESIRTAGQTTPIVLSPKGEDGLYAVAAGFRRVAAISLLAMNKQHDGRVLARVLSDGGLAVAANLAENEAARVAIGCIGRARAYDALLAQGYDVSAIAKLTGRARDFVADHARIAKGAPEVVEALSRPEDTDGACSWAVGRLVLRFPLADQPRVLSKVEGLSLAKATPILKALRDGDKAPEGEEGGEGEGGEGGEGEGEEKTDRAGKLLAQVAEIAALCATAISECDAEDEEDVKSTFKSLSKGIGKIITLASK